MIQTDLRDHNPGNTVEYTKYVGQINPRLTCIDLFAGAGGFSLGFSKAGFNIVAAVEISDMCCLTLRANRERAFPNMRIIQEDICKLSGKKLLDMVGLKPGELKMLIGGPPCQGFSMSNTKRSLDDPRSKLMFEFIRMTCEMQPGIFYVENVPGLFYYKDFFHLLMQSFEECGYVVRFTMMDASNYGVPQRRKRVFIQGMRKDKGMLPTFPNLTHFSPEGLKSNSLAPSPSMIAAKCFQVHGFTKEQIKDVWWNKKLEIMMNKKTAEEQVHQATNECILEEITYTIKNEVPKISPRR